MSDQQNQPQFDVVIVGSGVAGALLAFKLAGAGFKTLVLEAGAEVSEEDRATFIGNFAMSASKNQSSPYAGFVAPQPNASVFGRDYYVEDPTALPADLFTTYYERLVGGSMWHWQGIAIRMLPNDFKTKTLYGQGFDWPISYDDLEPWYCEAEKEMGVAGSDEEASHVFKQRFGAYRSQPFPMPEIAQSYLDKQFKAAMKGLQFGGVPLTVTAVPQAKNSVEYDGRPACDGRTSCIPLCPTKAKYEATFHIEKAKAAGAVIQPRSIVTHLEHDANGKITSVAYKRWDGVEETVAGRIYVLAANGIETPKILLMSTQQNANGVANSSGRVGQYLMDHPIKMSYALSKDPVYPFRGPPSTSSIETLRDGEFRKTRAAFRTTIRNDGWSWPTGAPRGYDYTRRGWVLGTILEFVGARKLFGDALRTAMEQHTVRQIMLNSATDMLPDSANRIVPSATQRDAFGIPRPDIKFKVDDYARGAFLAAVQVHARIFEAMGAVDFHLQADSQSDSGSGHIMGTTIMGSTSHDSVVDKECRSHDNKNLFIVGSSVFPSAATANPTVTVAALALRSAQAIQSQLRR